MGLHKCLHRPRLRLGYRLIDTAPKYGGSEAAIGRALKRSGVPRAEVFLATKVTNSGHKSALASFEKSLAKLGTDYVDLLLIHSAISGKAKKDRRSPLHALTRQQTWRALVELKSAGRARAIGVCNHSPRQLELLFAASGERPAVLQLEYHPMLQRPSTLEYCRRHEIVAQGFGSGGGGWRLWRQDPALYGMLGKPPIRAASTQQARSPAQVSLRWALEQGLCVIPKAASPAHQRENLEVFGWALTAEQTKAVGGMDRQRSLYRFAEPDTFL
jgi:2,5-diketo-D-gluconate reductase A